MWAFEASRAGVRQFDFAEAEINAGALAVSAPVDLRACSRNITGIFRKTVVHVREYDDFTSVAYFTQKIRETY